MGPPTADVYKSDSTPGKSAECMHGFIELLDICLVEWFLLENSDELSTNDKHAESLNLLCHDMDSRGKQRLGI